MGTPFEAVCPYPAGVHRLASALLWIALGTGPAFAESEPGLPESAETYREQRARLVAVDQAKPVPRLADQVRHYRVAEGTADHLATRLQVERLEQKTKSDAPGRNGDRLRDADLVGGNRGDVGFRLVRIR